MAKYQVNVPATQVVSFEVEADNFMQAHTKAEAGERKQLDGPENLDDFMLDWDNATAHEVKS